MKKHSSRLIPCLIPYLLLALHHGAFGQSVQDTEEQRRRSQEEAFTRQQQQNAPGSRILFAPQGGAAETLDFPAEQPCFEIQQLQLTSPPPAELSWVSDWLARYPRSCLGRAGIESVLRRLSSQLIAEGYVTTRLGLPEQSLENRVLTIELIPGRIRQIRFTGLNNIFGWRNIFPNGAGSLLNIRDLEQGLEQLKRLPSQDADIDIQPAEENGWSDVIVTLKQKKPWRMAISLDDAGGRSTGRNQGNLNLAWDNPTTFNDQLTLILGHDLRNDPGSKSTSNHSIAYTLPWGNWNFTAQATRWNYRQTVLGNNRNFEYKGQSETQELRIQRLLHRDQTSKTSVQLRTWFRQQTASFDQIELATQHRKTSALEWALIHRQYWGPAQFDFTLARREGKPWFGGQTDPTDQPSDQATWQYRINTLDGSALVPFQLLGQQFRWNSNLRLQHTRDPLYAVEFIAIGNRYTVRGFDGEHLLAAERGGYWKNELEILLGQSGQNLYFGLDYGRVGGPSANGLPGRSLLGGVLGVRGNWQRDESSLSYDIFAGWALHKPENLPTPRPTLGATLSWLF